VVVHIYNLSYPTGLVWGQPRQKCETLPEKQIKRKRTGELWVKCKSICLARASSWVQSPTLQKKIRNPKQNETWWNYVNITQNRQRKELSLETNETFYNI
jgi:hypothetical protein